MRSIHRDQNSPNYRIRFRYQGRQVNRSLRTRERRRAKAICGRVDEMIGLLERGCISVPADTDPIAFVMSDGRVTKSDATTKDLGLAE